MPLEVTSALIKLFADEKCLLTTAVPPESERRDETVSLRKSGAASGGVRTDFYTPGRENREVIQLSRGPGL